MSLVKYSNPILYESCEKVEIFDEKLLDLIKALEVEMEKSQGIGIAAPQIGVLKQIFIIGKECTPEYKTLVFINPILEFPNSKETSFFQEGCLSFPGISVSIERPAQVSVRAFNGKGEVFSLDANHLFSRVIQHEYDHLIGKTLLSHVGSMKKKLLLGKLKKTQKRLF